MNCAATLCSTWHCHHAAALIVRNFVLFNIQALRAAAALLVVFVHIDLLSELLGFPAGTTGFGNTGVDLFFVISGLIMVVTVTERAQAPSRFFRHRVARIVPLYWLITLMVFGLAAIAPTLLQSTKADPMQLLKSLAFIPYRRLDGQMHPLVFVGWTLNYEMMFYAIFAVGMLFSKKTAGFAFTLGALLLAVIAGQIARPSNAVFQFFTGPIVLEFGAGMMLGMLVIRNRLPASRAPALILGGIAFLFMLTAPSLWPDTDRSLIAGIPAFLIVGSAVAAERAGLIVKSSWIQLLGAASYSIYLTHFFVTQFVIKVVDRLHLTASLAILSFGTLCFALVMAVGIVVHKNIELPLSALARRLLGGRLKPLPRAAVIATAESTKPDSQLADALSPDLPGQSAVT